MIRLVACLGVILSFFICGCASPQVANAPRAYRALFEQLSLRLDDRRMAIVQEVLATARDTSLVSISAHGEWDMFTVGVFSTDGISVKCQRFEARQGWSEVFSISDARFVDAYLGLLEFSQIELAAVRSEQQQLDLDAAGFWAVVHCDSQSWRYGISCVQMEDVAVLHFWQDHLDEVMQRANEEGAAQVSEVRSDASDSIATAAQFVFGDLGQAECSMTLSLILMYEYFALTWQEVIAE